MAIGDSYLVLDAQPTETACTYSILYWIMIDRPATIDGKPVVVTPAARLPLAAKKLECVQQRSGELDTGRAVFILETVTAPRGAPGLHVHEDISRFLAGHRAGFLREYHRRYPGPRESEEPQEPQATVTKRPEAHPGDAGKRQCAVCGSEEAMLRRRADAATCSDRCRQRAYRRRRAALRQGSEASQVA